MSVARQKGTTAENEIVALLHDVGLEGAHRSEAGKQSHDIRGVGDWVIEVKHRRRWSLFDWVRRIRRVTFVAGAGRVFTCQPWAIFAIHGDRRSTEGAEVGRVAILDADMAAELIKHWEAGR